MKQLLFIILIASLLFSCKEDEEAIFDVDLSDLEVAFVPFEGGAYMNYTLPDNPEIYGIQVRYKDFKGKDILIKGTHTNTQVELFGFNEAQSEVPAEIVLLDLDGNPSKPVHQTFSTLPSPALGVFDDLQVVSHWNGFRVSYPAFSGRFEGYMHIYFVGINPETHLTDSLLVSSLPFTKQGRTVKYSDIDDETIDKVTVVIKTEDLRGNFVKKQVIENVEVARAGKFNSGNIAFDGSSVEDDIKKMGWKYLFDGDVRGEQCLYNGNHLKYYSYKSEVGAEFDGRNVITLDLLGGEEIAWIRIYSHLCAKIPDLYGRYFSMKLDYQYFYPNHVTLYGTNDINAPEEEWVELSYYYESATLDRKDRWTFPAFDDENFYTIDELDLFREADPNYIQLDCDITGNQYRYLKVKINETAYYISEAGVESYRTGEFGMEELEVYVKAE